MKPNDFIAMIAPAARACMKAHGIPASFTIAQAALESGWGETKLAKCGYNLFGVKADKSWHGPTMAIQTAEYVDGKRVFVNAQWRVYANWQESIDDRASFFTQNKRYAAALTCKTGEEWAKAVADARYSTNPNYADLLCRIMRSHDLAALDGDLKT